MERLQGKITFRGPGFIFVRVENGEARQDFFIHKSEVSRRFFELREGDGIEFTPELVTEGEHRGKYKGVDADLLLNYITNNEKGIDNEQKQGLFECS